MKKGLFFCLSALVVAMLAVSCGSAPAPASTGPQVDPNSPPWLNDFPPEDAIWGIGMARQSSEQMSMTIAETRARASIARQLNAKIEDMVTDYNRDAGTVSNQAALSLQEVVTRQVTSMQLNGTRPLQRWKAPDNTYWFLLSYSKADAQKALTDLINNTVDSEAARYAEFKTDEALKMLDAQLAKNAKPVVVND